MGTHAYVQIYMQNAYIRAHVLSKKHTYELEYIHVYMSTYVHQFVFPVHACTLMWQSFPQTFLFMRTCIFESTCLDF